MRATRHGLAPMLLIAMLGLAALGCAGGSTPESETAASETMNETGAAPASDAVQQAAEIANAIEAAPDRANEILEAHGMTAEQFEALLYEIAQDPAKSEAYAAARQAG